MGRRRSARWHDPGYRLGWSRHTLQTEEPPIEYQGPSVHKDRRLKALGLMKGLGQTRGVAEHRAIAETRATDTNDILQRGLPRCTKSQS